MSTIATICARGGSSGLKGKNIRELFGKPLIVHTIEHALRTPGIQRVFVSTDDEWIASVARKAGAEVPFIRPIELATAKAPKLPVIRHLVESIEQMGVTVEKVVDLDPTSPLRTVDDITACLKLLSSDTDVVITGYSADKNPYFNMVEVASDGWVNISKGLPGGVTSRQEAPSVYSMNASVYVWWRRTLDLGIWGNRVRLHVMPRERSIDIDSLIDFEIVKFIMAQRLKKEE